MVADAAVMSLYKSPKVKVADRLPHLLWYRVDPVVSGPLTLYECHRVNYTSM